MTVTKSKAYTYRDFVTGKTKRTYGKFYGWSEKTGVLNVRYAIFECPCTFVNVPEYCLTQETKRKIEEIEMGKSEQQIQKGTQELLDGLRKASIDRKIVKGWLETTGNEEEFSVDALLKALRKTAIDYDLVYEVVKKNVVADDIEGLLYDLCAAFWGYLDTLER